MLFGMNNTAVTYAALLSLAPHLAALCPVGDDAAAAEVYAASIAPRPSFRPFTAAEQDTMEPAE